MSTDSINLSWAAIGGIIGLGGALGALGALLFRAGRRDSQLLTREELEEHIRNCPGSKFNIQALNEFFMPIDELKQELEHRKKSVHDLIDRFDVFLQREWLRERLQMKGLQKDTAWLIAAMSELLKKNEIVVPPPMPVRLRDEEAE